MRAGKLQTTGAHQRQAQRALMVATLSKNTSICLSLVDAGALPSTGGVGPASKSCCSAA